mmetsp:Transcript_97549/g.178254  ORF Transcript_97549/g.178254 Transcript_97549/m.178254 type:complete len:217 (-) Transcript_97549:298-948(-)
MENHFWEGQKRIRTYAWVLSRQISKNISLATVGADKLQDKLLRRLRRVLHGPHALVQTAVIGAVTLDGRVSTDAKPGEDRGLHCWMSRVEPLLTNLQIACLAGCRDWHRTAGGAARAWWRGRCCGWQVLQCGKCWWVRRHRTAGIAAGAGPGSQLRCQVSVKYTAAAVSGVGPIYAFTLVQHCKLLAYGDVTGGHHSLDWKWRAKQCGACHGSWRA